MKILIQGSPGSGKNVIAAHLADKYKIKHINYRSIVIEALTFNTKEALQLKKLRKSHAPLPPLLAFSILKNHIESNSITDYVLDGYPKSENEAFLLREYLNKEKDNYLFIIETPKNVITKRLKNRLVCPTCAYVLYDYNPNNILEINCMTCHTPLMKRSDDNDEDILLRIERFEQEKRGIINQLSAVTNVKKITGAASLAKVINEVVENIDSQNPEDIAEKGARLLIEGLGLNLADPNVVGTPRRLVKSLRGQMNGQYKESQDKIREHLETAFPTNYKGLVIMDPIKCVSLCSHHLMPINYEVLFGYIPKDKSIGFSKICKVINLIAAKPALQEDFTQEIIDVFNQVLDPKGIMVVVRGKHSCMTMRGNKSDNTNITSALRGVFKDSQTSRDEFLSLAKF